MLKSIKKLSGDPAKMQGQKKPTTPVSIASLLPVGLGPLGTIGNRQCFAITRVKFSDVVRFLEEGRISALR